MITTVFGTAPAFNTVCTLFEVETEAYFGKEITIQELFDKQNFKGKSAIIAIFNSVDNVYETNKLVDKLLKYAGVDLDQHRCGKYLEKPLDVIR